MTTVREVARIAGVSVRTVSYVTSGSGRVSDATRVRVQQTIDRLGYRPNPAARFLQQGRTGLISLGVPDLDIPYFAELATIILQRARTVGTTVLIEQTAGDPEAEARLFENSNRKVDGVILSPLGLTAADVAARADGLPVVLLGEVEGDHVVDHVAIDNVAATALATEHLVDVGCRRIALIGAQRSGSHQTAHLRERGYRQALAKAGHAVDEQLVVRVDHFHRQDGRAAFEHLANLADRPDGVVCLNDLLAIGALRSAHDYGIRVPRDVAIIGVDDIEETRYSLPTLSTIQPDKVEIGRWAVDTLLERIEGDRSQAREQVLPFRLVVRESTTRREVTA